MENLQRREGHGAEQAAGGERPTGSVEGLVVDVNDVRVAHDFPRKFALIHVADAVGGEVGDVEFEDIATGLEEGGSEADAERKAPRGGDGLAVEDDARAFADVTEVEQPVVGWGGGSVKFEAIAGGAAEAFGFIAAEIGPGFQGGGFKRGREFGAALEEGDFPSAVEGDGRGGGLTVGPGGAGEFCGGGAEEE